MQVTLIFQAAEVMRPEVSECFYVIWVKEHLFKGGSRVVGTSWCRSRSGG